MPIAYARAVPTNYDFITKEDRQDSGLVFRGYGFAMWKAEGEAAHLKAWLIRNKATAMTKEQAQRYLDQYTTSLKRLDGTPVRILLD